MSTQSILFLSTTNGNSRPKNNDLVTQKAKKKKKEAGLRLWPGWILNRWRI